MDHLLSKEKDVQRSWICEEVSLFSFERSKDFSDSDCSLKTE